VPSLFTWTESRENRKIRRQRSRLLPNGLCQRCHEIATNDLEWLRASKLEDTQVIIIRLAEENRSCRSCRFFARWKPAETVSKYTKYRFLAELPTKYYFLAVLPAEQFGLNPIDCRLCSVTRSPIPEIHVYELRRWKKNQHCMLQREIIGLSQDRIKHLPFGHNEYGSISSWLSDCMTNHLEQCPQATVRTASLLYCIDCADERVVPIPENAKYFALSYVWGVTHTPNKDESLSNAPAVIKDAMRVTLGLRFRYLWVDRYCIDQHDADQKHQQIANMGNIYAGATLTLVVAGSTDPDIGLPGVSSCRCNLDAAFDLGPYSYVPLFGNPKAAIRSSKWSTRGWTYQEAVMSARKLVFTSDGFYTQCNMQHSFGSSHPIDGQTIIAHKTNIIRVSVSTDGYETFEIAPTVVFPGSYSEKPIETTRDVLDEFFDHIFDYVRRDLSYESDRLNAIQGVLNEYRANKDAVFQVFGVPLMPDKFLTINSALFWRMENNGVRRRADFPSWSWLGWQYNDKIPDQPVVLCDLEDEPIGERYSYQSFGPHISLDEHSARISVEFSGGGLLNLTEPHLFSNTLDMQLPREARIMPHLVIRGVIFPLIFEKDEVDEWVRVGDPSRPFHRKSFWFTLKFRMWLDVPFSQEQDAFHRNQIKALVLGLADQRSQRTVIRYV
jgi:hypothetical protein